MAGFILLAAIIFGLVKLLQNGAKSGLRRMQEAEARKALKHTDNYYIQYHKHKLEDDKRYNEYLEWMSKNNIDGVPVDKLRFLEEERASKQINENVYKQKSRY